jgi:hypothetical protein
VSAAKALIAVPLPPISAWQLIRRLEDLPEGFAVIGSITVGATDVPQLESTSVNRLRKSLGATPSDSGLCERCPLRSRLIEAPPEDE